jgi:hypothetical protein
MRIIISRKPDPKISGDKVEKNKMGGHEAPMGRRETYKGCFWGNVSDGATWETEV